MEQYTTSNEMYENYMEGYTNALESYNAKKAEYEEQWSETQAEYANGMNAMLEEGRENREAANIIFVVIAAVLVFKMILSLLCSMKSKKTVNKGGFQLAPIRQFMDQQNQFMNQQLMDLQNQFINQQLMDQENQLMDMQNQMNQQFMEDSIKSVTPFEHGGFDMNQGNSFNMNFGGFNGMF